MVDIYRPKYFNDVVDFIMHNVDEDFYFTKDNIRHTVNNAKILKALLKESSYSFVIHEKGDVTGIILLWKSIGNGIARYYVKLNAKDTNIADKLITVLLWHLEKDIFVKIRKDSKFVNILQSKGFKFIGDRGKEILMIFPKEKSRKVSYGQYFKSDEESRPRFTTKRK